MTTMSIETNLRGRLRNTTLPLSNGLLPVFEAVVNSIHAIEDRKIPATSGKIEIEIVRDDQLQLDFGNPLANGGLVEESNRISGFRFRDNGIGFTDQNMQSFRTLDSEHKSDRAGRGVGRLLWLKAFKRVSVESVFLSETEFKFRTFSFNSDVGIATENCVNLDRRENSTFVYLDGFEKRFQQACVKTASSIANQILEHCLWYFVRPGSVPRIFVKDSQFAGDWHIENVCSKPYRGRSGDSYHQGWVVSKNIAPPVIATNAQFEWDCWCSTAANPSYEENEGYHA